MEFLDSNAYRLNSFKTCDNKSVRFFPAMLTLIFVFLFSGGVDNCVKLWDAHSICNPDDDDDDRGNEK